MCQKNPDAGRMECSFANPVGQERRTGPLQGQGPGTARRLLLFACQELFLPDIRLLENRKKCACSKLLVTGDRDEPPFLFIPEMNMADALFYRAIAEQDKRPDYIMR